MWTIGQSQCVEEKKYRLIVKKYGIQNSILFSVRFRLISLYYIHTQSMYDCKLEMKS